MYRNEKNIVSTKFIPGRNNKPRKGRRVINNRKVEYFYVYDASWKELGYFNQKEICDLIELDWISISHMMKNYLIRGHFYIRKDKHIPMVLKQHTDDKYKNDDYVYYYKLNKARVGKITSMPNFEVWQIDDTMVYRTDIIRHATDEEIKIKRKKKLK